MPKTSHALAGLTVPANIVIIKNFAFNPSVLTVNAGEKVIWAHDDAVDHIVVLPGLSESQLMKRGDKFEYVFSQPGEYKISLRNSSVNDRNNNRKIMYIPKVSCRCDCHIHTGFYLPLFYEPIRWKR